MSSVPHLPLALHPLRTGRTLLAAGLMASALSGCAIWPKALTWGGADTSTPTAAAEPLTPPPAPPMVAEEAPKANANPVTASAAETATIEPRPVLASTPVMAPPEAETPKATGRATTNGKANAKDAAKSAPTKASSSELVPGFYINVGLFAVPSNGTNAFRTLEKAELPVFTDVVKSKKGALTRVRVGPYMNKALADAAADKIKGMKLEAVVFQR